MSTYPTAQVKTDFILPVHPQIPHALHFPGRLEQCYDVAVPKTDKYGTTLFFSGSVGGVSVNDSTRISLRRHTEETFIQTDKYLYRPGEKVQFRVLTITGNLLEVFREKVRYPNREKVRYPNANIVLWPCLSMKSRLPFLPFV